MEKEIEEIKNNKDENKSQKNEVTEPILVNTDAVKNQIKENEDSNVNDNIKEENNNNNKIKNEIKHENNFKNNYNNTIYCENYGKRKSNHYLNNSKSFYLKYL